MEPSTTKKIAKNFSWLASGELTSRGINFLTNVYIARVLGAASFGLISFAQAFMTYLILLVDSGLTIFGTREIAQSKNNSAHLISNLLVLRFLIAALSFTATLILLFILPLSTQMRLLFIGTFLFVFYRALNVDWAFQGLEKMEWIAAAKICFASISLILVFILVKASQDLLKVPFIISISGILTSLILLFILYKQFSLIKPRIDRANWWIYLAESVPLGISAFLSQLYGNSDTILLGFMRSPEIVGYYSAAYKIFLALLAFLGLWQNTAFPIMTKRFRQDKLSAQRFLNKYIRITLLFIVPIVILIAFLSPYIIKIIYGGIYAPSSIALQILIFSAVATAISGFYSLLILIPLGKSREVLYGVSIGAIANLFLNLILIPFFSYIGSSVATLLTEITVAISLFYFVRKEIHIPILKNLRTPCLAALTSMLCWLVPLPIGHLFIAFAIKALCFMVAYLFIILLLGEKPFLFDFFSELLS